MILVCEKCGWPIKFSGIYYKPLVDKEAIIQINPPEYPIYICTNINCKHETVDINGIQSLKIATSHNCPNCGEDTAVCYHHDGNDFRDRYVLFCYKCGHTEYAEDPYGGVKDCPSEELTYCPFCEKNSYESPSVPLNYQEHYRNKEPFITL